ncbi:MAG: NAD-dependent epimerase/dehydratase family protein [Conexivisphaera sp.]
MARILITGGAGFIGSNLARALISLGHEVRTLDVRESDAPGHVVADVTDLQSVRAACRGVDYVFHLAAVTSPPEFADPLGEGYRVNVMGTYNVLAAALSEGARRVILASSSAVYGDIGVPAREEMVPSVYGNLYPLTKLVNELTARTFVEHGLETISLRYFNTYGVERSKGGTASVVWRFIDDVVSGRRPVIYGDGTQRRDFVYVEDAVRATILAMERGRPGEAYNVGTGVSTTFNDVFRIVKEETGYEGEPLYVPNPLRSYQRFTQADTSKARRELGFEAAYDLRAGVRRTLELLGQGSGRGH